MSAQSANEQNYWKAYCQIIKSAIAPTLGPNASLFFCTETTRCIPSATWIPTEVTNLGLYFMADSLLDPTNMFYVPNKSKSFLKTLQTYLAYVDIGGDKGEGARARYMTAQANMAAAQQGKDAALTAAIKDYGIQKGLGMTTSDFAAWATTNAPVYQGTMKQLAAMVAQFKLASADYNGALAAQYNGDVDRIEAALGQVAVAGLTMPVTDADLNSLATQFTDSLAGKTPTLPPATGTYQRGAYSLQGYKAALDNWKEKYAQFVKNPQRKSISLQSGKDLSVRDFGFTNTSGEGNVLGWFPIFSFGASFNESEQRESLKIETEDFGLDMYLTYGDMQAFPINPGSWYFGNPNKVYPTLRKDAPPELNNIVKPVSILCGSALGLEVNFKGSAAQKFDSMYQHYKSVKGGVRILGFNIDIGGDRTQVDTSVTHSGSWNSDKGQFTVTPVDSAGWCTLLGVLAERSV